MAGSLTGMNNSAFLIKNPHLTERLSTEALDELTAFLGGDGNSTTFAEWSESQRVNWLLRELQSTRPLVVPSMLVKGSSPFSERVREVLDTFRVAAEAGPESISEYVISMAKKPSDVLAVELLRSKVAQGCLKGGSDSNAEMRVVPLFETLEDLEGATASPPIRFK